MLDKVLITEAKRTKERSWMAEVSTVSLQQVLRDCHTAYQNFFDSLSGKRRGPRVGLPRFKRRAGTQTARFTRRGFALRRSGRLYVAKVGELKVAWSRDLPAEPSSVTLEPTRSRIAIADRKPGNPSQEEGGCQILEVH
ncbi:hypothetical protein [Glycomyces tritici]|uniref:Transposase n=1 Tax=Glycomyces tritici TaxID=2665176 RepID=A0ABT7YIX3_9ACTN|nr:hypothetical protein [Glycomyces tritici]MDN3238582.1 hypothetical protein [Glycomyces tritici]